MRRTLTLSFALALGLAVVSPAAAAVRTVTVGNFYFEDSSTGDGRVVVDKGDRITFSFQGNNQHSATVDGLFDSGVKEGGQSFTTGALMQPGTYVLYCTQHGARQHGSTLVVRGAAAPPSSPTPKPSSAKPTPAPTRTTAAPRATASSTAGTAGGTSTATAAAPTAASSAPVRASTASPSGATSAKAAPSASASSTPLPTPTASAPAAASEVDSTDSDNSSRSWLLPVLLVGLLLLGGGAYALSRRNRAA